MKQKLKKILKTETTFFKKKYFLYILFVELWVIKYDQQVQKLVKYLKY